MIVILERTRVMMELSYFINLIFIFAFNVFFFFLGTCLNSLVVISFWRSPQLRKKLCYFTIMLLSSCDVITVLTNHPLLAFIAMSWLNETFEPLPIKWLDTFELWSNTFLGFSLAALLVMNFDRYLATSYPLFHRASVTKRKLLILLGTLIVAEITLCLMAENDLISRAILVLCSFVFIFPPMLFINYKVYMIARKSRRNDRISPRVKKTIDKNISSCLLAVACFVMLSIPAFAYIGLRITSKKKLPTMNNIHTVHLVGLWAKTIVSMNSTFNCLIFYWKNKTLRTEGMKVIKSMKIRRKAQI